jgi:hypothetical protein
MCPIIFSREGYFVTLLYSLLASGIIGLEPFVHLRYTCRKYGKYHVFIRNGS